MKLRLTLYITIIILLNIAATTLFFRVDLTENRSYSLSEVSKELVKNLEEPLTIKVFLSENLPVPYNTLERDLRDILIEYDMAANRHFNYTLDLIKKDGPIDSDPATYNIHPVQIQNIEQDEMKVVSAYIGMVLIHGDMVETIPAIEYNQNLELLITEKVRTITEKTSALLSMRDNIQTTLYLSPELYNFADELRVYSSRLQSEINNLNREFYNRITYTFFEPNETEIDSILAKYPSKSLSLEDSVTGTVSKAIATVVVQSGEEISVIDIIKNDIFGRTVITDHQKISEDISSSIDKILETGQRVGYLSSHGTIPMQQNQLAMLQGQQEPSINNLLSIIYKDYALLQIDLKEGYISDDIKTLIIARPQERFTERELYLLDQFLMKGNSILLALDQIALDMEQSNLQYGQEVYKLVDHGLIDLLKSYGIEMGESIVMDENSFKQLQRANNGGVTETQIYFAPQLKSDSINSNIPFMKGVNDLLTFRMSPVTPVNSNDNSLEVLFSSSEQAWAQGIDGLTMNPAGIYPSPNQDSYPLAVIKSGSFNSYFQNREIPKQETKTSEEGEEEISSLENVAGKDQLITNSDSAKLLVLGSSDMLTDQILNGNTPSNTLFVRNAIDSLSDREEYTLMRSKGVLHRPMDEVSETQRSFIKFFNIFGLPILVICAGILTWFLWLRRKQKIMQMFMEGNDSE